MPRYELSLILRHMSRTDTTAVLKRTADSIFDKGGIIRRLDNLGQNNLPHKISEHGVVHKEGNFFAVQFDTGPTKINDIKEELGRDIDIIRRHIFKVEMPKNTKCTLSEELQSPVFRTDVQEMMNASKRKKAKYDYNSGLEYYPFQK